MWQNFIPYCETHVTVTYFQIKNAFNKVGIDHVVLVKVACAAVVSKLMGLTREQTNDAISQAFADGQPLRVYRQSPNTRYVSGILVVRRRTYP